MKSINKVEALETINFSGAISRKELGLSNKDIKVKKISGINIKKFRNMGKDSTIDLANRITLVSGHNGTMKSTLIGLCVQPFNSDVNDIFGSPLKTNFREIFRLSSEYDKERYEYDVFIEDTEGLSVKIPVYTKPRSKSDPNIRIVTGGNTKGDGNLIFNTNYLNLNRLYSIHSSDAIPVILNLTDQEKNFISKFYNTVLIKDSYNSIESVQGKGTANASSKKTFGPKNSHYNFESISSGEDNLGRIAISLISFMRAAEKNKNKDLYNGIFCIDEIEASLHPVAQINLFNFLYKWSGKYKVQILVNSHSLPLIRHAIQLAQSGQEITTYYLSSLYSEDVQVKRNHPYESIYKELTFDFESKVKIPKVDVLCEDKLAINFIKRLVTSQQVLRRVNFIVPDENEGLPYNLLIKLCRNTSAFMASTIIVFDADVPNTALSKVKKDDNIIQLPNKTLKLPIEKLFVKYLLDTEKNDTLFFSKIKKPKDHIISTLIEENINPSIISDINKFRDIDTKRYKKWFSNNQDIVNKVFNTFVKQVEGREEFTTLFIKKINKICEINGYPSVEIN
ncbi:AAA family ATPase [Bacillus sp. FSL M8-0266]|uniref:AAA family ATPase n=1 Tax=Bacillus TaxID=1386 RepID=UPI000D0281A3|nr:AAA family ATPase [Bacillus pumilus]MBB6604205.1 AAA family ATPase [Bacillus pumilus]PRS60081.1 hypothetical protein C6X98_17575 [Bacillus pumilus]